MNADPDEALEMSKTSKRENRVYVGNLHYDVKYRDLMEFMRSGGWGNPNLFGRFWFFSESFCLMRELREVVEVAMANGVGRWER